MKQIPLSKGSVALVDDADYDSMIRHSWHLQTSGTSDRLYARNGNRQMMHRLILGLNPGDVREADHIDGDGLNNQRSNLRVVTHSENLRNTLRYRGSFSKYKGVWYDKRNKRYRAAVMHQGNTITAGSFKAEEDAATAYNFAAYELFGELGKYNRPIRAARAKEGAAE